MIFQVYYSVSGCRTQGTMQKTKPGEGVQRKGDWVRPDGVLTDGLNHSKLEPKGFFFLLESTCVKKVALFHETALNLYQCYCRCTLQ